MHLSIMTFVVATFAILNPIGNAALFVGLSGGTSVSYMHKEAFKTTIAVFAILLVAIWIGNGMLDAFGISVGAFSLAGGVIVLLIGLDMVRGATHTHKIAGSKASNKIAMDKSIAIVPMAIPIIAGPGTITTIIVHANLFPTVAARIEESFICLGLALVVGFFLFIAPWMARLLGEGGMKVVTRLMGVILAAMAAQMMIGGIKHAFGL